MMEMFLNRMRLLQLVQVERIEQVEHANLARQKKGIQLMCNVFLKTTTEAASIVAH